jgi:hypothetical protein
MEFKYFNGQAEISESTYKLLASGNKPKPTLKPAKAVTTYKVKPKPPTIEQQRCSPERGNQEMTGGL